MKDPGPEQEYTPEPRHQRAACFDLNPRMMLLSAKIRAEGFDVVDAKVLREQDEELARLRTMFDTGGPRVAVADFEDDLRKARRRVDLLEAAIATGLQLLQSDTDRAEEILRSVLL